MNPYRTLLSGLTDQQLSIIEALLYRIAPDGQGQVDLAAIVSEVRHLDQHSLRALLRDPVPDNAAFHDEPEIDDEDGGRFYELTLHMDDETARQQWLRERERVRELMSFGYSAERAWERVRNSDMFRGLGRHANGKTKQRHIRKPRRRT